MEAVVLGLGPSNDLRPLVTSPVRLAGHRLACLPLLLLRRAGVKRVVVVVVKQLVKEAYRLLRELSADFSELELVGVREPVLEAGSALAAVRDRVCGKRLIIASLTSFYAPEVLSRVLSRLARRESVVVVGADSAPRYADPRSATKILADSRGRVKLMGASLTRYNYVSVGVAAVRGDVRDLARGLEGVKGLGQLVATIKPFLKVVVADVTGAPWFAVRGKRGVEELLRGRGRPVLEVVVRSLRGANV